MLEYVLLQLRQLPEDTVKPFLHEQKNIEIPWEWLVCNEAAVDEGMAKCPL